MREGLAREEGLDAAVLRAVDRATAELRRGGLVVLQGADGALGLVQAAEGARAESLAYMTALSGQPLQQSPQPVHRAGSNRGSFSRSWLRSRKLAVRGGTAPRAR